MAFCSECGNLLQPGAKFCFQCGTPVHVLENIPVESNAGKENVKYVQQSPAGPHADEGNSATIWTKPDFSPEEPGPLAENVEKQPDRFEEDDDDYDFSQHDFDRKSEPVKKSESDLSNLSTAKSSTEKISNEQSPEGDFTEIDPAIDPFYDSIMPEIENEVFQIPKDIFLKAIGIVATVIIVITWLLFVLS